jgi:hypothetical protein
MIIVLFESEILDLLKMSPELWVTALKRGKGVLRFDKSMDRKCQKKDSEVRPP